MPAQATANSVIASAKRLIEVRHVCLSSSRIAEISVPAWPMPIHQTKLVMSNAQPTGTLLPQMPMPFDHQVGERHQQQPGEHERDAEAERTSRAASCRVRTIELILSVTEPKVCPGAMTGGVPAPAIGVSGSSIGCSDRPRYSPSSGFTFRTAAR